MIDHEPNPLPGHGSGEVALPDLPAVLERAWALLARGAVDRRCVAHTPTLATVDAGQPSLRTVVLRGCEVSTRELLIHTDRRSPKIAQLRREPGCGLHVYDAAQNLQIRVRAVAQVHLDDALAAARWSASRPSSREVYGSPWSPGEPVDDPRAAVEHLRGRSEAEQRAHFAVLVLRVIEMDVLLLAASGHLRAFYHWDASGQAAAGWRVP